MTTSTMASVAWVLVLGGTVALLVRSVVLQRRGGSLAGVRAATAAGDLRRAGAIAERLLAADPPATARPELWLAVGRSAMARGDAERAATALAAAARDLDAPPDTSGPSGYAVPYDVELRATIHLFLGIALMARGDLHAADHALSLARELAPAPGDRATASRHLAVVRRAQGHLHDARSLGQEALLASTAAGDGVGEASALRVLAQVDDATGDWTSAAERLVLAAERSQLERRDGRGVPGQAYDEIVTVAMLARALAELGRTDEARRTIDGLRPDRPGAPPDLATHVAYFAAAVHRLDGRPDDALRAAERALDGYRRLGMHLMAHHAERQVGLAQAAGGDLAAATATLRAADAGLTALGCDLEAGFVRDDLRRLGDG